MSKKIVILGGTGFIGKNLIEYIIKNTTYILFKPTRAELNLLDSNEVLDYFKKVKPDFVIIAAVDILSVENSIKMFHNIYNAKNNIGLVVNLGSGAEYDKRVYLPYMKEDYIGYSLPVDTYGMSKYIIGQEIEQDISGKFLNLRIFGIFGKYEDYSRRFISNNIIRALSGLPISMNKDMKFDYIDIEDLMNFLHKFVFQIKLKNKTYNFCRGESYSLMNIAEIIQNKINVNIVVKQSGFNLEYSGDNSLLTNEIGNISFKNIEKSVDELIIYYKSTFSSAQLENFRKLHSE
jgi:UDP-glucose 4-epimerase